LGALRAAVEDVEQREVTLNRLGDVKCVLHPSFRPGGEIYGGKNFPSLVHDNSFETVLEGSLRRRSSLVSASQVPVAQTGASRRN
jgi:hypothetical protein